MTPILSIDLLSLQSGLGFFFLFFCLALLIPLATSAALTHLSTQTRYPDSFPYPYYVLPVSHRQFRLTNKPYHIKQFKELNKTNGF